MDIQRLIETAGGVGKLAASLGLHHSTVCEWQRAGAIPASRVVSISRAFGVPTDDLLLLVKQPKPRARKASGA